MLSIHTEIQNKLNIFIKNDKIPNIIFHGENGCGKKTILKNFLNTIYKDTTKQKDYVMYVNCAFGKGIKFIRDELKFFAKSNIHANNSNKYFKSIVLLYCELLTTDAQSALRRCIELFSKNTRFFILVNDKDKLLKPIVSRFSSIFVPLPIIDNNIINLHNYKKINLHEQQLKTYNKYIKKQFQLCDLDETFNIIDCSLKIYEKGISYFTIEKYFIEHIPDTIEKYSILLLLSKYKKYNKNDKLLISQLFNLYRMRNHLTLENIYSI